MSITGYSRKINKIHLWVLLGLILLNLAIFALNLNDFFLSDDFDWLYLTKTSDQPLCQYFASNYFGEQGAGGSYRPMFNVIFSLNYSLFGLNPLGYHLFSLLFHIGVCFLVYLLARRLFDQSENKDKIAILAAIFFSILPNHSEAVIWAAAVGDPFATFFYLLAFYLYIVFRQKLSFAALLVSVLSFVIALLTKEVAITLPLLIIVWELYQAIGKGKFDWQKIILYPLGYWLLLLAYFIVRYLAIGVAFGYYAEEKFRLDLAKIFKMFVSLPTNLLFYGNLRVWLTNYFVDHGFFFILLLVLIITLIWYALRQYRFKPAFFFDAYFILILPVLPLAYNYFNDEGERYNYLPSVMFCILLSLLVWQIKKDRLLRVVAIGSLLFYFLVILVNKNYNWHLAGELTEKMVKQDVPQVINLDNKDQQVLFISLPDNLAGAQVFRNAIGLAIKLYYPQFEAKTTILPVYLRLTRKNMKEKILYWGTYPTGGYIAETFDHKNWVTGQPTGYEADYTWELWDYNYNNYTTNKIRFYLAGEYLEALKNNALQVVIFNQGELKKLSL